MNITQTLSQGFAAFWPYTKPEPRPGGRVTQVGRAVCWAANPLWSTLPIMNVPNGATVVKRRIRCDSVAMAFVKVGGKIQQHRLSPFEDGRPKHGETMSNTNGLWLLEPTAINVRK